MRAECLLARRLRGSEAPHPPAAEVEPFGCVAIIDISDSLTQNLGYTRLTDRLAAVGGIDRIRDVLNPPFELIIETVHERLGSVVKLAGDAAVVVWSVPPKLKQQLRKENHSEDHVKAKAKQLICSLAILCCMELLELFQDYQINLDSERFQNPARTSTASKLVVKGDNDEFSSQNGGNSLKRKFTKFPGKDDEQEDEHREYSSGTFLLRTLSRKSGKEETFKKDSSLIGHSSTVQPLSIHIGLGFGEVHHVFVGNVSTRNDGINSGRCEYFISGNALLHAGIMLNRGKSGQLVFSASGHGDLEYSSILDQVKIGDDVHLDLKQSTFAGLKNVLEILTGNGDDLEFTESKIPMTLFEGKTLPYVEPSLLKHLDAFSPRRQGEGEFQSHNSLFSDNANQYRTITVLFLRLSNIPIERIGTSATVISDVNFAAQKVIEVVTKNGGTCRQIHADDKGLSALLVWGVEGFSHEKGDHLYAVTAAMEIERALAGRKWWHQAESEAMHKANAEGNFSIAVTMGKA
ncbi:hypothetical protein HDU97_008316 [Phlyctochytrium planicorne]|nr:hypothetical protein HDU97_008316 [Phlyctochytrium planicorne]